jgi:Domain of unknown function (DUF4266)
MKRDKPWTKHVRPGVLMAGVLSMTLLGCAPMEPVRPWQKEALAKPEMALTPDVLEQRFHGHIYFSREAAVGGHSVGGGGCGCN